MDLNKLEEMLVAANIALPVRNDDLDGRIESADGKFMIYDEGGASEEAAAYVVALINAGPELIATIRKQEVALTGVQSRMGGLLLEKAGAAAQPVAGELPPLEARRAMFAAYSECLTSTDMTPVEIADKLLSAAQPVQQPAAVGIKPDPAHLIALALSGALPDQQAGEILSAAYAQRTSAVPAAGVQGDDDGLLTVAYLAGQSKAAQKPDSGRDAEQAFEDGKRLAHEQATVVTHALMAERDEWKAKATAKDSGRDAALAFSCCKAMPNSYFAACEKFCGDTVKCFQSKPETIGEFSKAIPSEAGYFWHWDGDNSHTPALRTVFFNRGPTSDEKGRAVFNTGGYVAGFQRNADCEAVGGYWAKAAPPASRDPAPSSDAARYDRLRVLGAAPYGSANLDAGTVLRFTNLDAFVDADIKANPSRGEFAAHPANGAQAGALPEGWRIVPKKTCYALVEGNSVIASLAGPDAEENAAIIARVLAAAAPQKKEG